MCERTRVAVVKNCSKCDQDMAKEPLMAYLLVMRPEFTFMNLRESVQTEFGPQEMLDPYYYQTNTNIQEDNVCDFL